MTKKQVEIEMAFTKEVNLLIDDLHEYLDKKGDCGLVRVTAMMHLAACYTEYKEVYDAIAEATWEDALASKSSKADTKH